MFCSKCGAKLPDDSVFCFQCGVKIPLAADTAPAVTQNSLAQTYVPHQVAEPSKDLPSTAGEKPANKKPRKNGKWIALIAVALVFVLAVGLLLNNFVFSMETVYVLTRETEYNADGVLLAEYAYEYDDFARLTSVQYDYRQYRPVNNVIEYQGEKIAVIEYIVDETCEVLTEYIAEFEYDDHGNLTANTVLEDRGWGLASYDYEYRYTDEGIIKKIAAALSGSEYTSEYKLDYDSSGNIKKVTLQGESEDLLLVECQYDDENRLVREIFCNYGAYDSVIRYDYFYKKDKLVGIKRYSASGRPEEKLVFNQNLEADLVYGKHGLTQLSFYDEEGAPEGEYRYFYDSKGHLTERSGDDNTTYTCDKHGNILRAEAEDGSYIEYEYQKMRVAKLNAELYSRRTCLEIKEYLRTYRFNTELPFYYYLIPNPLADLMIGGRLHF